MMGLERTWTGQSTQLSLQNHDISILILNNSSGLIWCDIYTPPWGIKSMTLSIKKRMIEKKKKSQLFCWQPSRRVKSPAGIRTLEQCITTTNNFSTRKLITARRRRGWPLFIVAAINHSPDVTLSAHGSHFATRNLTCCPIQI